MTNFFLPIFGPFPQLLGQKTFFKTIGLSCTTLQGFLAPWQNTEKSNYQIPRKHSRQTSGGKDGQALFHRILLATAKGGGGGGG